MSEDSASDIKAYLAKTGITFPVVADDAAHHHANLAAQSYEIEGTPTNFLIGPDGRQLAKYDVADETTLRADLSKAGVSKA